MNFQSFIETLVKEENLTIEMSFKNNLKSITYDLRTNTYYDIVIYNKGNFIICIMDRGHRYGGIKSIPLTDYESTIKALCKLIKEECMTPLETFCSEQCLNLLNKYA